MANSLSKYNPASVKELFTISFPLMLSTLASACMIFIDRIMLSHYNIDTMNSVSTVANTTSMFIFSLVGTTTIAEVFVGQYNGSKNFRKLSSPVWQMIWLSLFSSLIFVPCAFFGGEFFIPEAIYQNAFPFYFWMVLFSPVFGIVGALSSFFIGRGKTIVITISAFIANILNISLNYFLIFGIGSMPPLGAGGAAIGTVISNIVWAIVLFALFLREKYRKKYHTSDYSFDKNLLIKCLKVGTPSTISHFIEMFGWTVLGYYVAEFGKEYLSVYSIAVSIYILFVFYMDGLSKGVAALSANFIGAKKRRLIQKIMRSAIIIHLFFVGTVSIVLLFFPEYLIDLFKSENAKIEPFILNELKISLRATSLYFLIDGFAWIYAGIMIAGGDTRFLMFSNLFCTWILTVIPCILWFMFFPSSPSTIFIYIYPLYATGMVILTFYRIKSGKWLAVDLNKKEGSSAFMS